MHGLPPIVNGQSTIILNIRTMRITIMLFLLLSSCAFPNSEKEQALTQEEEEIAKALIQGSFDKIWGGVDSSEIANYHTDDFIILEHGEVWDNDRIKAYIRSQLQREDRPVRKNRMEYISMEKYGASIQMAYHNYAEFMRADTLVAKRQWLESALAVKTDEGWRLKMMHSTRVPTD